MMTPRFSLTATTRALYGENDELQVSFAVVGSAFSGELVAFDDHRKLAAIRLALTGFPKQAGDAAMFEYGIFDRVKVAIGTDAKGHASVVVRLEKYEGPPANTYGESISVRFWCDRSSIDDFCASLAGFVAGEPCEALLIGRTPNF
ncbi:hypothetical protein J7E62_01620 [Variovorax paradoxus]|nr:hypothetical protein [Variovorax paradoxus]